MPIPAHRLVKTKDEKLVLGTFSNVTSIKRFQKVAD